MEKQTEVASVGACFNSHSTLYKKPFGALPANQSGLELRISVAKSSIQVAGVSFECPDQSTKFFSMSFGFSDGQNDFFEVNIDKSFFDQIGVFKYKFVLANAGGRYEMGPADSEPFKGVVADAQCRPFELSVYDANFSIPEWFKNGISYQVYVDRFYDGNPKNNLAKSSEGCTGTMRLADTAENKVFPIEYHGTPAEDEGAFDWSWPHGKAMPEGFHTFFGGDLDGVCQKLDYLKQLGVTILYLNPINWSPSNHKYDATDYHHIDPAFADPVFNEPGNPDSGLDIEANRKLGDEYFIRFVKEAESKGFKVILDGVFNHCSADSVYFDRYNRFSSVGAYPFWTSVWDKVNNHAESVELAYRATIDEYSSKTNPETGLNYQYPEDFEYIDWFNIWNENFPRSDLNLYECLGLLDHMPTVSKRAPADGDADAVEGMHSWNNINFRKNVLGENLSDKTKSEASEAIQKAAAHKWIWMGGSGWRLDAVPTITDGTWRKFRTSLNSLDGFENIQGDAMGDLVTIGELWNVRADYLLGDMFHSLTNYPLKIAFDDFILRGDASKLHGALESIREAYPPEAWYGLFNLFDSHDTARLPTLYLDIFDLPKDLSTEEKEQLVLKYVHIAVIFYMGYAGTPNIYYGDEVGLDGGHDPECRKPFPWSRVANTGSEFKGVGQFEETFDITQKAIAVRKNNPVFVKGNIQLVYAKKHVIAYSRQLDNSHALVIVNRSAEKQLITTPVSTVFQDGVVLEDMLDSGVKVEVKGGELTFELEPLSGHLMIGETIDQLVGQVDGVSISDDAGIAHLNWPTAANGETFNIYRSIAPFDKGDTHYQRLASSVVGTSFSDKALEPGVRYYYAVSAVKAGVESDFGSSVSIENKVLNDVSDADKLYFENNLADEAFDSVLVNLSGSDKGVNIAWQARDIQVKNWIVLKNTDSGFQILKKLPSREVAYTDFLVQPDLECQYQVVVEDQDGNFHRSEIKTFVPSARFIDVTIRLVVPDYTPIDDHIYIAGDFNLHNYSAHKLERSSEKNIWLYRFKAKEGEHFSNYSFYRNSSIFKLGCLRKDRVKDSENCNSNWAYMDGENKQSFVVENQGNSSMVVTEYVARWMDFPLVFLNSELEFKGDQNIQTKEDSIQLTIDTPYGVELFVNGASKGVARDGLSTLDLSLDVGENKFVIEAKCSDEHAERFNGNVWHTKYIDGHTMLVVSRVAINEVEVIE